MAESHDSLNGNLPKPATAVTDLVLETRKIGSGTVETIDARRLHAFLEVGRIFAAWLPDRIDQYGFVEGVDYLIVGDAADRFPVSESKRGGHNRREYALTLDMAKELSMVERNAKGKEARRYFIECEKRARLEPLFADLPHLVTTLPASTAYHTPTT